MLSRRSLSSDATAVELALDLEDGEKEGGRLCMLMDFGNGNGNYGGVNKGKRKMEENSHCGMR